MAFDAITLAACVVDGHGRLHLFDRQFLEGYRPAKPSVTLGGLAASARGRNWPMTSRRRVSVSDQSGQSSGDIARRPLLQDIGEALTP